MNYTRKNYKYSLLFAVVIILELQVLTHISVCNIYEETFTN